MNIWAVTFKSKKTEKVLAVFRFQTRAKRNRFLEPARKGRVGDTTYHLGAEGEPGLKWQAKFVHPEDGEDVLGVRVASRSQLRELIAEAKAAGVRVVR